MTPPLGNREARIFDVCLPLSTSLPVFHYCRASQWSPRLPICIPTNCVLLEPHDARKIKFEHRVLGNWAHFYADAVFYHGRHHFLLNPLFHLISCPLFSRWWLFSRKSFIFRVPCGSVDKH